MRDRIIFIASDFPPRVGGIAEFMYGIVNELPPDQVRVIGLPISGWKMFDAQQRFSIFRLRLPSKWSPFDRQLKFLSPLYFGQLLREKQVGVVICCHAHYSLMFAAWLARQWKGTPYGVFLHGLDVLRHQTRSYQEVFNALLRSAQIVFPNGRATKEIALRIGVNPGKMHTVHPCVNQDRLAVKVSPEVVRQKYGLEGKKCILTVGRLIERKGFDMVIRVLPAVLEAIPEAHYLMVGTGPIEASLKALVAELGLEAHITFAGYVPDEALAAYYLASDVFVMTSREILEKGDIEGFGIVYLEANFMGKPVVAGRSGGVADAVIHEETGFLVDPGDPAEIATAITRLLRDPELARRLGEAGRRRVLSDFTSAAAAQKVLSALSEKVH